MGIDLDVPEPQHADEEYFEGTKSRAQGFDARLLREPISVIPSRTPLIFEQTDSASAAMRAMQRQHRGCVLITDDGTARTPLRGIFTERDVLLRIIDRGRHPGGISLAEVMTSDPETLPSDGQVAWVLNMMSVGGFRHVPAVDEEGRPAFVISVRDVVQYLVEAFPTEVLNLPPGFLVERYRSRDGA